ncbi:MAG: energy transducer TonB [Bacteroidales bacterium]|nr:energy transducer TonB [Candidatus Physcousia equi]
MEATVIAEDIRKQKGTSILIGFCVTFALLFAAFELTYYDVKVEENDEPIYEMATEEDMIPVTIQEEQQPAAPVVNNNVQPEILQIVEDEVEIKDEKIETSEEVNQVIVGTVGTGAPTAAVGPVATGPVVEQVEDDRIFDVVEQNAQFPGGDEACYKWLSDNIKYPPICSEQGIQGRVFVSFVVNKDGSIVDVKIVRSPDENLSKEAERVVKMMPKWKPARQGNKTVRSRFNLPVLFRLN